MTDMNREEHELLTCFRRLPPAGKREMIDYAGFLLKKCSEQAVEDEAGSGSQCRIGKQGGERPETAKEPIFTE